MKKLMIVVALAAFAVTPALAADMAVKAPPPASTPAWSWAGCYVGVNGGYGWNNGNTHYNDPNTTADPINFVGTTNTFIPTPSGTGGAGGLGGGGAGCNWQYQQWVIGFEADIDGGRIAGSQTNSVATAPAHPFGVGLGVSSGVSVGTASEHSQIDWLSTMRARVGLAIQDRILLFATGGFALGGVSTQGSVTVPSGLFGQFTWSGSNSTAKMGTAIGGGAEWAFADRWTAKAEYLWYDLGNVNHSLNCTTGGVIGCTGAVGAAFATLGNAVSSFHGSIVRFGINYRFN